MGAAPVVVLKLFIAGTTHEHLTTDAYEKRPTDFSKTLAPTDIKLNGAIIHLFTQSQNYERNIGLVYDKNRASF